MDWAKTGKVPAQLSVINDPAFKALPEQATIAAARDIVHFPASIPNQPGVDRVVQDTLEAFYAGKTDVDQTVAALVANIPPALTKIALAPAAIAAGLSQSSEPMMTVRTKPHLSVPHGGAIPHHVRGVSRVSDRPGALHEHLRLGDFRPQ